ncbi:MAG: hypothetical protein ACE5FR_08570 [Rhodospirillales bacterium]
MSKGDAMLTRRRVHTAGTLAAVLVLFLCAGIGTAGAQGIPRHLASMAKDVLAGGALDETTEDPQQDAIRQRARQILKDAGARYWARGEVRQEGAAAAVAKALEMDISKPDQWAMLRSILGESDHDTQIDGLRRWAKDAGKPTKGPEFEKVVAKFDEAREGAAKDLARHHTMEVGDNKDRLELDWDPINNGFEIRIRANETSQGAGDGFELQMNGDVTSAPAIESDDTTLTVRPSDSAMSVLTDEDLRRLKGAIFGKWRNGNGDIWEISASGGGSPSQEPAVRPRDRIAELERQIERIWSDKVFRWKNTGTGEVVVQDKFKRLKEGFKFLGQDFRRPDAKKEITRLQKRIEELHAASNRLPVDSYDPVRMGVPTGGEAQSLRIRVTDTDGYAWTYDTAVLSVGRITAKRTLRDIKDIGPHLPGDVRRQLVTSWSAPEWIELEVRVEGKSRQVYMTGLRWRLHVTYDGFLESVKRIHTPYSRNLRLERASLKVAEGAAKDQKP